MRPSVAPRAAKPAGEPVPSRSEAGLSGGSDSGDDADMGGLIVPLYRAAMRILRRGAQCATR